MYQITALDVKALRQADKVCFHHMNGKSYIRLVKELKGDPFRTEADYKIETEGMIRTPYTKAFEMFSCPRYTEVWQTILAFVKVGDALKLMWNSDNSNQYVEQAGLHTDELLLTIIRGDKQFAFLMAHCTCPDNTARMVRRF